MTPTPTNTIISQIRARLSSPPFIALHPRQEDYSPIVECWVVLLYAVPRHRELVAVGLLGNWKPGSTHAAQGVVTGGDWGDSTLPCDATLPASLRCGDGECGVVVGGGWPLQETANIVFTLVNVKWKLMDLEDIPHVLNLISALILIIIILNTARSNMGFISITSPTALQYLQLGSLRIAL